MRSSSLSSSLAIIVIIIVTKGSHSQGINCTRQKDCVWSCITPNGEGVVDLTGIGNQDASAKWTDQVTDNPSEDPYHYSYNPCYPFNEGQGTFENECNTGNNNVICQITGSPDSPSYFCAGDQTTEVFQVQGENVVVMYTGAQSFRQSYVTIACGDSESLKVHGERNADSKYRFTLVTKKICFLMGGEGGISTGTIICIIFVAFIFGYLVFGIIFMKYFRHAEGLEVLPNRVFWLTLPGLVKDGVTYSFTTVSGKFRKN